jgi:hypothetical protein
MLASLNRSIATICLIVADIGDLVYRSMSPLPHAKVSSDCTAQTQCRMSTVQFNEYETKLARRPVPHVTQN